MTSTNFGRFHQGLNSAEGPELWLQGCCAGPHVQSGKEKAFVWDVESKTREQGCILWLF